MIICLRRISLIYFKDNEKYKEPYQCGLSLNVHDVDDEHVILASILSANNCFGNSLLFFLNLYWKILASMKNMNIMNMKILQ